MHCFQSGKSVPSKNYSGAERPLNPRPNGANNGDNCQDNITEVNQHNQQGRMRMSCFLSFSGDEILSSVCGKTV